jgi:capsular polysaccharide export protein
MHERAMIAFVIDSMERYYFARRLVNAVRKEFDFLFLTSEPIAHVRLCLSGFRSVYLHRAGLPRLRQDELVSRTGYETAIEVLNGHVTLERARRDADAICRIVSRAFRRFSVSQCLIWNGQQLLGRTISKVCEQYGIQRKFLEISNLPDKLFVDGSGVNALSTISADPTIIDALPMPNEDEHRRWLEEYERYKARPLPQSQTFLSRKAVSSVNYALKFATRGVARTSLRTVRMRSGAAAHRQAQNVLAKDFSTQPYVFLPLQVSGDTQIKLHSDVNNAGAVEIASGLASRAGVRLLVKLHPAENDAAMIAEIVRLQNAYSFDIVAAPTTELIKHAQKVVTINSTVGLEALLYGKEVISLGRCFYKEFDRVRLLKYIHSFLVDGIDYFGSGEISVLSAQNVLSRAV